MLAVSFTLNTGGGGTLKLLIFFIAIGLISAQCGSTASEYAGGVGIHLPTESLIANVGALLVFK